MNEFIIRFVGIIIFLSTPIAGSKDAQHVVIPAFRNAGVWEDKVIEGHIPHIAFTVKCGTTDCVETNEWGTATEFSFAGDRWAFLRLDGVHLSVESASTDLIVEPSFARVPRLKDYCSQLELLDALRDDTTPHPKKAATLDILGGTLEASGDISRDEAAISTLKVAANGNLTITATPHGGGAAKKLVLRPGTKIVIGNQTEADLRGDNTESENGHYFIYYWAGKPNQCMAQPGPHAPGHANHIAEGPDVGQHAACSNSTYP